MSVCRPEVEFPSGSARLVAGQVLSYTATAINVVSRLPQIVRNWRRRMTEGLNMTFMVLDCAGNGLQTASTLSFSSERGYLVKQTPFVLATSVSTVMDIVIIAQALRYRRNTLRFIQSEYRYDSARGGLPA